MNREAPDAPPANKPVNKPVNKRRSAFFLILKCIIAAALLWWLSRSGRFDLRVFSSLRWGWDSAGVLGFQVAMLACMAARWHFLTRALNLNFSFRQTLRISLIGFYAAILTPASLGLDGARLLLSRQLRAGQNREILASVLWDRVLGLWSLLVICALCGAVIAFFPVLSSGETVRRAVLMASLACGVLALALAVIFGSPKLPARIGQMAFLKNKAWLQQAPPRAIFGWPLLLGFATHGCNLLATFFALRIFESGAPLFSTLPVAPFVILSSLVPLTPLGLGVTDSTAALLFAAIGVAHGAAATMILRATFVLISLIGGLAWLWPNSISETESVAASEIEPLTTQHSQPEFPISSPP